nr:restriction endonuclease subunit S [uncultured Neisseria sp.]
MDKQQEPRLRFQGFTGAWEEKVLGEVTEYLSDGTHFSPKSQNGEYKYITSKNIRNSGLDLSDVSYISAEEHQEIYKRCSVKFGDLLLTKDGASTGNCCINFLDEEFSLLSSVAVLRPKQKKHNANFLCQVLQSPIGQNEIKGSMAGQAITRITLEKLRAYKFNFPLYEEQTHLGLFFRRLDSQIAESRAVLEKSRQLKKAMLAKMFPANGEKIPKIRFKGFEGEWKTRSLRDVLEIERKGKAQYQKLQAGNVPYLDAEFINGGVKILTDAVPDVDVNDILIIWDGSNAGKVYTGFNGVLGSTLKSYRTNADCSSMFLYQELVRNEEVIFSQYRTPNIPHVIKDFSDEYNFLMPSYKEQTAIGLFFRQLDETIDLQSAEVEKLNQLKKGLLAAMLV